MSRNLRLVADQWTVQWASFDSSEVCRIVGMSSDLLRQWRCDSPHNGNGERELYDTVELAETMLQFDLKNLGLSTRESADCALRTADMLVWYALLYCPGTCEVWGTRDEGHWFIETFKDRAFLADKLTGVSTPPRFLLRQGNSELEFAYDLAGVRSAARTAAYIDLVKSASDLVTGASRPLCTVGFEERLGSPRVRRTAVE